MATKTTTPSYGKIATSESEKATNRANLQKSLSSLGATSEVRNGNVVVTKTSSGGGSNPNFNGGSYVKNEDGSLSAMDVLPAESKLKLPETKIPSPTQIQPPNQSVPQGSLVDTLNAQGMPSSFNDRANMASQQGIAGYTGTAEQNNQLLNKFKQALPGLQASGQAPDSGGLANKAVQEATNAISQENVAPSIVGDIMETDSNFDSILTNYDDFFSPPKQKQSLVQEYQSLLKSSGIQSINAELLDAKRVIEGTEDDIRLEVEKAGGFATDSQVQALANGRNKSLIKNYNYLLESRDSAMTQLNTMMNLTIQDRQQAEAEFDRKLNFAFKVQDYKDKALNNAREGFNNVVKSVGYEGLFNSLGGNQTAIARAEKTLGLSSGGLQQLASYVEPVSEKDQLQLEGLRLDNAKKRSDLSESTGGNMAVVPGNKPSGKPDFVASGFANRSTEANDILTSLEDTNKFLLTSKALNLREARDFIKPQSLKKYEQAQTNFLNAVLRKESGASISPEERASGEAQYFAKTGDGEELILQKQRNRIDALNSLIGSAGKAYDGVFADKPTNYKKASYGGISAPDGSGDTIILTN